MVQVIWTKKAFSQLERSVKYIEKENGSSYAEVVLNRILDSTRNLGIFPQMGALEPFLAHMTSEYRYLVVWSYKIVYRVTKERVIISRIFHTAQNPDKIFK